jgi:hypothetical protein
MVRPAPLSATFSQPGYYVWCGSPLHGPGGKYYLYYSRWPVKFGFHPGWAIHSEIACAFSDNPLGPYRFLNVALPPRGTNPATGRKYWDADMTHNPMILECDGRFLLYYIGNFGDGRYETHRNNDRIGVAIASQPQGPWQRLDHPVIDVSPDETAFDSLCVSNPAVAVRPDGGILMLYKGVQRISGKLMGGSVRWGVAVTGNPEGPYIKKPGRVFEAGGAGDGKQWMFAEDAFVWFSRKYGDRYYAVARDVIGKFTGSKGGIALFQSLDGLTWTAAPHPKVLGGEFHWANGTTSGFRIERPALLFDGEDPIVLFGAANGYDFKGRISFNVQIPLKANP